MSKIVEELLEEFPELKGNSKVLKELVDSVQKHKGNIEVSPVFKAKLRKRIENVIALKTGKQKTRNWFYFLVPSLTFCLVLFGVFVVYKDISFFDKNNDNFVPAAQNTMFIEGSANVEENNYLPESVENSLIPLEDVGVNDYLPKEIMQDDLAIPAAGAAMGADMDLRNFSDFNLDGGGNFTQTVDIAEPMDMKIEAEALDISAMLDDLLNGFFPQAQMEPVDFEEYCLGNSGKILETSEGRACITERGACLEKNFTGFCN